MRFKWWQLALVVSVSVGFVVLLYVVAEFGRLRGAWIAEGETVREVLGAREAKS